MTHRNFRLVILNQSQSPAFQQLWERLSEQMGTVLVFTGMPHPPRDGQVQVEAAPRYRRQSLATRAVSWLAYGLAAAVRVVRLPGRPLLFAVTNPPFLPQIVWLLHRLRGYPYALLFWDIYPDHMVQVGLLKPRSWLTRAWTALNRRALLNAAAVITISQQMADVLRQQLGEAAGQCRIAVIPNWADTDEVRPLPKPTNPFAVEHGQVDKVTVLYSGNMGRTHGLGVLVEAARQLRGDARVAFLLIGDGLGRNEIEQSVRRLGLNNVTLCPLLSWDKVPYSLATGDIAVITQAADSASLSLPSKTYSMLAAGCAIIACTPTPSDLADLVQANQLGAVCAPGDGVALAAAIKQLADDPVQLAACRERARQVAEERFSVMASVKQFENVMEPIVQGIKVSGRSENTN